MVLKEERSEIGKESVRIGFLLSYLSFFFRILPYITLTAPTIIPFGLPYNYQRYVKGRGKPYNKLVT